MRVNLNLNESNSKDKKIIDFLESKYSSSAYIKEVLYQLTFREPYNDVALVDDERLEKDIVENKEEGFDEILGVDGIEL